MKKMSVFLFLLFPFFFVAAAAAAAETCAAVMTCAEKDKAHGFERRTLSVSSMRAQGG